jgi:uncharacterized protein
MFFALFTVFTVGIIAFVYGSGLLNGLTETTKGLVQRSLIPNVAIILVFVYGLLIAYGKLRPVDLGLEREKVLQGVSIVVLLIIILQITSTITGAISNKTVTLGNLWSGVSGGTAVGILICQLFAVSVQEEIIFRGFLMPQVYLRIKTDNKLVKMSLALIVSQALFAVWHLPIRIFSGMSPISTIISMLTLLMLGVIFALLYIRTNNLFIVMGIHGLWNVVQATAESNIYMLILVFIMAILIFQGPKLQKSDNKAGNQPSAKGSL